MRTKQYLLIISLVFGSAGSTYWFTAGTVQRVEAQKDAANNEYQVGGTLYMQTAGEYRALAYQAFTLARMSLDSDDKTLRRMPKLDQKRPRAVMVDIDETILDNSRQQAHAIKNRTAFNLKDWYAWGEMREAPAIPGSVAFLNYAYKKGVKIFYASNRDEVQKQATIDNLKAVGFPDVNTETVMLRTTESNKEPRRQMIQQKYRIVLLLGDDLNDFSDIFEKRSVAERNAAVDGSVDLWGKRWIVLPNAMYGDWENAIYGYKHLTDAEKTAKRQEALLSY